jgi:hypothetical protein
MADVNTADVASNSCCAPERQATCCGPSAKADCCGAGHVEGCGCDATPYADTTLRLRESGISVNGS